MGNLRIKAGEWLFNQGATTVLLFALLYAMYRLAPSAVSKIHTGYIEIVQTVEASQERQIKTIVDEFRADQDRDRDLLIRLIEDHKVPLARNQP